MIVAAAANDGGLGICRRRKWDLLDIVYAAAGAEGCCLILFMEQHEPMIVAWANAEAVEAGKKEWLFEAPAGGQPTGKKNIANT